MPEPVRISATIITYNEERKLEACLRSLEGVADEIVVVDSLSTDGTRAVCERYPVRFVSHAFEGYVAQKNFAAAQADRKSTRLNSSHSLPSRMPSSA